MHIIAPSIFSADFANLQRDIEMVNRSAAQWLHCDIMDGMFVPNLSFGLPVLAAIKKHSTKPLDVHLMIAQPDRYLESFKQAGADVLTVHIEACTHLHRTLQAIRALGMKAGVALNPHTPAESLFEVLPEADLVCIMSVNPGFGGQKFIQNTYDKLGRLNEMKARRNPNVLLEIDGGVTLENTSMLLAGGADVLVAGNTVFSSSNPTETIAKLVHEAAR